MRIGSEMQVVTLRVDQAVETRDALAKALYEKVFHWVVNKINVSFGSAAEAAHRIGLVDLFGFEFFETNSFEQICINYANEKLQNVFNAHVFVLEQKEYERERIEWQDIAFSDNQAVLQIFEGSSGKPNGLFKLLDE